MVLFFDLDRFKDVNDTLGHRVGDQLLIEVAERTGALLAQATAFARLGGDEFAALVPLDGSTEPQEYGDAIVDAVSAPFLIEGHGVCVAASVGIATGDVLLDDGHELLRRADAAMYAAKGAERGACRIFDERLSGRQLQESFIRAELNTSLADGSLCLHYQPLIDARTGALSSAEALLRGGSAGLQSVDTATLIAIAEKSGQIIPLTEWTMDVAFAAIRELKTTPIALNISPIYFRRPQFVHNIIDRLLASNTPPELLTIEVTEGVLISDMNAAREAISHLRNIGVKVYLDDFGTCYSSLSYLQHFELDGLKLDKTFLRNIGDQKKATRVVKAMIDFGHSLDMRVVMEGVESDWQVRLLQLLGCDLLQGYELGAPMSLKEIRAMREQPPLEATIAELRGRSETG
jgi:diguanylate cyclase (GGDEF)-like protein